MREFIPFPLKVIAFELAYFEAAVQHFIMPQGLTLVCELDLDIDIYGCIFDIYFVQ